LLKKVGLIGVAVVVFKSQGIFTDVVTRGIGLIEAFFP
jgi:hypothetical protein